jgi:subtilisin family serine protease
VTATDQEDKLFHAAVRGKHIAVAAPGVELWLPGLDGTYQEISGTSFSAAEVSGTVALMLERQPGLDPEAVRRTLMSTARDLGPRGLDPQFGAGLVDAYKALMALKPETVGAAANAAN